MNNKNNVENENIIGNEKSVGNKKRFVNEKSVKNKKDVNNENGVENKNDINNENLIDEKIVEEYIKQAEMDTPDLWDRIESGFDEELTKIGIENETRMSAENLVETPAENPVETPKGKHAKAPTNISRIRRRKIFSLVAVAAAIVLIIIPVSLFGNTRQKDLTNKTGTIETDSIEDIIMENDSNKMNALPGDTLSNESETDNLESNNAIEGEDDKQFQDLEEYPEDMGEMPNDASSPVTENRLVIYGQIVAVETDNGTCDYYIIYENESDIIAIADEITIENRQIKLDYDSLEKAAHSLELTAADLANSDIYVAITMTIPDTEKMIATTIDIEQVVK